ncbi:MAG: helix-turn-helix domain-containing protein [Nitrososphaeria archaeon]|jgi:DNA invertase Pin-like site-specific DNA recombinase
MSRTVEEVRAALAVGYLGDGDDQEPDIRAWAEDHGYMLVGAVSASGDRDPPSRVLELCSWNGAKTILARDLSSFGPDLQSSYEVVRKLYASGISVVLVSRGLRIDGRTALGKLMMELLSMAVELAASQRNQRQQSSKKTGRPPRSVDEAELLKLRERGMSVRAIAKALDVSKSTVWRKLRELESGKAN